MDRKEEDKRKKTRCAYARGIYREDNVVVILASLSVEATRNQQAPFFRRPTSENIRTSLSEEKELFRVRGGARKISLDKDRFDLPRRARDTRPEI